MAFDSVSLLGRRSAFASNRAVGLRVTSRNTEILDRNMWGERRAVRAVSAGATEPSSVQGQITLWPLATAVTTGFWPTWVFGPRFAATQDEDSVGVA
jgi:hypothetical protein